MWPEFLYDSDFVIVTGPPRSGTHLAADCIALDFNWHVLYETAFDLNNIQWMKDMLRPKTVVQAPFLLPHIAELQKIPKCSIVIVQRNVNDILASQEQFNFTFFTGEIGIPNWQREQRNAIGYQNDARPLPVCQYEWLQNQPQEKMFWLDYKSLKSHKLWKELRDQTFGSQNQKTNKKVISYLYDLGLTTDEISMLTV